MAVHDCTYVNSASVSLNLNGSTYKLLTPGPRGIYSVGGEAYLAVTLRRLPPSLYQAHLYRPREIALPLRVVGSSWSALATNVKALWDHFYTDLYDEELGVLTYTAANSNVRSIQCALKGGVDFDSWMVAGASDPANAIVNLPLVCPDPTFYDPTPVTPSGAFNGTTPVTISCANAGGADAYPTITYTTDGTYTLENPQVTDAHGNILLISATMAVSKVLTMTLDPNDLSIKYGTVDWLGYRGTSDFVVVKAGTNNLTFQADNVDANAAITISFCSRYPSHG